MSPRTGRDVPCDNCGKLYYRAKCVEHRTRFCSNKCRLEKHQNRTHGYSAKPEWWAWYKMKLRCFKPTIKDYQWYGARGITVCERWMTFENFLADMGDRPSPSHSLERIDNDGNYEPGNCKWATKKEQGRNRRGCWTQEEDDRLRQAIAEGLNFSEAARLMGKSPMSTAARGKRIGLSTNFDPHAPRGPKQRQSGAHT